MTEKARKLHMSSNVLSRILHNAPIIAGETAEIKEKVYKIVHKAARFVKKSYCFKMSIANMMKSIGWKIPKDLIDEASAKFMHRILFSNEPEPLSKLAKPPRSRNCADYNVVHKVRTNRAERTAIHT